MTYDEQISLAEIQTEEDALENELYDKLCHGKTLTEKEVEKVVHEFGIETEEFDEGRWTKGMYTVSQIKDHYYGTNWERGLTEYQPNEYLENPVPLKREPHNRRIITITCDYGDKEISPNNPAEITITDKEDRFIDWIEYG